MEMYVNFRFLLEKTSKRLPSEIYEQIEDKLGWRLQIRSLDQKKDGEKVVNASSTQQFPGIKKAVRSLFERLKSIGSGWNLYPANGLGLRASSKESNIPGLAATEVNLTKDQAHAPAALFAENQIVRIADLEKTRGLDAAGKRGLVLWAIQREEGKYRYGILAEDDPGILFLDEEELEQDSHEQVDNSPICQTATLH